MSPDLLAWLMTAEGSALLTDAARLPPDPLARLTALRRRISPERAAAIVAMLQMRRRALAKLPMADRLFFTEEGLEQATTDPIAQYRAARFPVGVPVLDACCGIGSDAAALSKRAPVLAVDLNPAAALCARENARLLGGLFPVHTLCADVITLDLKRLASHGIGAAFFDPSRRADRSDGSRRRVRDASDYLPPLAFLSAIRAHIPALCVKVSPALDDDALGQFGARIEFLSDRGECKEAALWFGAPADSLPPAQIAGADGQYIATLLRTGEPPATLQPFPCDPAPVAAPGGWLLEPDPAVIRAHLVSQVAALTGAAFISPGIAYLTADSPPPTPFASRYRILDSMPYHEKTVRAKLRQLGRRVEIVKKRDVPLEPDQVRKALHDKDRTAPPCVLVLARIRNKVTAILCDLPEL